MFKADPFDVILVDCFFYVLSVLSEELLSLVQMISNW